MQQLIPGLIIGFREGLEAFLIVVIILRILRKTKRENSVSSVWKGVLAGITFSLIVGGILYWVSKNLNDVDAFSELWGSIASVMALVLVTTFIIWMIKNGSNISTQLENKLETTISNGGIFLLVFAMIAREGVEITIFGFAGGYSALGIILGILIALILVVLIFYSLVKINLKLVFNITLIYLVLQAGYLLGFAFHEGVSSLEGMGILSSANPIFTKFFDLSDTVLSHKTGAVGIPLYVAFGWYSKPEIIQFAVQYVYTITIFAFWWRTLKRI